VKPYYEHAGITIYHGDCRDVLPTLTGIGSVVTDPPWQTSSKGVTHKATGGVAARKRESVGISYGDIGKFDASVLRTCLSMASGDCFVVCGYKELGKVIEASDTLRGIFGWHKPNGCPTLFYPAKMDLSFIVWSGKRSHLYGFQHWRSMVFSVPMPQAGCMASERILDTSGKSFHPAQGPERLYRQLLAPLPIDACILDPYVGSGTTLFAAKRLGLRAIGIEIEERYCEIAAKRLSQEVLPLETSAQGTGG
jgi:site-specific DNA-methyltransferase (adenine-specific)